MWKLSPWRQSQRSHIKSTILYAAYGLYGYTNTYKFIEQPAKQIQNTTSYRLRKYMNCSILTIPYHLYMFIQSFWIDNGPSAVTGCYFRSFKMSFSHNPIFTFDGIYASILYGIHVWAAQEARVTIADCMCHSTIENSRIINYSKWMFIIIAA